MLYIVYCLHIWNNCVDLGYSGADLALVCETAALKALERVNPELVTCDHDDQPFPTVTTSNIQVLLTDFQQALQTIPSSCDRLQGS